MPIRNLSVDLPAGFEADEFAGYVVLTRSQWMMIHATVTAVRAVLTAFDDVAAKVHVPADPVAEFHRQIGEHFERAAAMAGKLAG